MTRTNRRIAAMILAVMLSVIFAVPSFAGEAEPDAIEEPKETEIIRDADAGTVAPEVIAAHTPEMTWEFTHPEETKPTAAPKETPKPKVSEPAPKETKAPVTEAPATEAPVTEAPATAAPVTEAPITEAPVTEAPVTEAPVTEAPVTEAPAAETPVTEAPASEEPAAEAQETETPAAAEPADETAEAETAGETAEPEEAAEETPVPAENAEEPQEDAEEQPAEEPEELPEDAEAADEYTVNILISMEDEFTMKLRAVVNDPEDRQFIYQWQVSEDGGENYLDILGATADELQVELTEENMHDMWRVWVQAI